MEERDKKQTRLIWKIYKLVMIVVMTIMAWIFIANLPKTEQKVNLMQIYNSNSEVETGSENVVTGIYLDYRLYDSIFESLLLLVTVSAISYLNKTDFDV